MLHITTCPKCSKLYEAYEPDRSCPRCDFAEVKEKRDRAYNEWRMLRAHPTEARKSFDHLMTIDEMYHRLIREYPILVEQERVHGLR